MKRILAIAVVALAMVSCSSGGASTDIEVTVADFSFTPNAWEVPAGETISITLTNDGANDHEWVILQDGVKITSEADLPDTEEELVADFIYWEEEVEKGDSKTVTFTAPAAGTYQIICALEGHFDDGMEGTLTVTDS